MTTIIPGKIVHPLGLAICLALAGDLTLFALLPIFRMEIGLTLGAVGVMFGVNRLVRVIGNPIAGDLIPRVGKRRFLLAGYTLAVVSTFGYAMVHGFWPYMLLRIAWGLAWILMYMGSMTAIFDATNMENRGKYSGIFMTWFMVGLAGGSLLGGGLADWVGYKSTMLVCSALAFIAWLVILTLIPNDRKVTGHGNQPVKIINFGRLLSVYRELLIRHPRLKSVLLIYLVTQFANDGVALGTISLLYIERFPEGMRMGAAIIGLATAAGLSIAFRYIVSSLFSPLFGSLSDGKIGRAPVIVLSLIFGMLGFIILSYAKTVTWIGIALFVNALSVGTALSSLAGLLGDLTPKENEGQALGLYASAGDLGGAIGSMLCYALLPFINLSWIYILSSAVFCIVLLFAVNWLRTPGTTNKIYKTL
jgi:MFS family permease